MAESPKIQTVEESPSTEEHQGRLLRAMDHLRAKEVFETPQKGKEFLDSLNFSDFKKFLEFANGTIRGLAKNKERAGNSNSFITHGNTGTVMYRPPRRLDREDLLKTALSKAQATDTPAKAGLTLALAINAIHPFNDGNGRTARLIYTLAEHGYNGEETDQDLYYKILENTKGRDSVDVDTRKIESLFIHELRQSTKEENNWEKAPKFIVFPNANIFTPGEHQISDELELNDDVSGHYNYRSALHYILSDKTFSAISIMAAFTYDRAKDYLESYEGTSNDGAKSGDASLRGDHFIKSLNRSEISIWHHYHDEIKREYVENLISFSQRPDADRIVAAYQTATE